MPAPDGRIAGLLQQTAGFEAHLLSGHFDPLLVAASVLIAIFASYTALDLAGSVTAARGRIRLLWLAGGSLAMGVGIWSMHFIGMLALQIPDLIIAYDVSLLVLSVAVAIIASAIALFAVSREKVPWLPLVWAGLAMGTALAGMHYIGIASMRTSAAVEWNGFFVAASIVVAVGASFAGLALAFRYRTEESRQGLRHRAAGSVVMGFAISGMHYTAMSAMTFFPLAGGVPLQAEDVLGTSGLAIAVTGTTLLILAIAVTGSVVERAFARKLELAAENARLYREAEAARAATEEASAWSAFLAEAGSVLSSTLDHEEVLRALADLATPKLADWCGVDVFGTDGRIRRVAVAHVDPEQEALTREILRRYPPDPDAPEGVAKVLRTGEPELIPEISDAVLCGVAQDEEHLRMLREAGMRSAMIVPLVARRRILGTIALIAGASGRRYGRNDLSRALDLATRAALAVDNARLYEGAEREERRSRFLSEASTVLATSLDYNETLGTVARLAIPTLADYCVIDLVDERQRIRRLATAHRDPTKERLLQETERYPPDVERSPLGRALVTGKSELVPEITEAWRETAARDARHLELIHALGARSVMIVPLTARGHTLGVMTFAAAESGRRYGADDLALAEEIARRAAIAVDNARLYEAALVANQAKTDFLGVVSHELRTPLNAIIGYTDLLEAEVAGPVVERQKEQLGRIESSARHLLQLIDEILTYTRMEAGREEVRTERVDLGELVREVAAMAEPLAREKGLGFRVRAPEEPTPIETDAAKVRQILLNLLSNAVKFTNEGKIGLEARVRDGGVVLEVRDTGIGIAPGDQDQIFDPFTQVENSLTREKGGTGLGLSVARRLSRLMGGDVTVASEPRKGTTFAVVLPSKVEPLDR